MALLHSKAHAGSMRAMRHARPIASVSLELCAALGLPRS